MRIFTYTFPDCGTIVSANELEDNRVMKCHGLECQTILRFKDLSEEEQQYFLDNRELYQI